jgi:hypothetical protein
LEQQEAKIDYFATSLPTLLLFNEDLDKKQSVAAKLLQATALTGLGVAAEAKQLLTWILLADPDNLLAIELAEAL